MRAFIGSKFASGAFGVNASAVSLSSGLSSLQSIDGLPPALQAVVRDAFASGGRWAFLSLVPWCALATISTVFLSNIKIQGAKKSISTPEPADGKEKDAQTVEKDVVDVERS